MRERDFFLQPTRSVLHGQSYAGSQIGTSLRSTARRATTEGRTASASEEVGEDVAELREDVLNVSEALTLALQSAVAVLVVQRALLLVREHAVGFRGFL